MTKTFFSFGLNAPIILLVILILVWIILTWYFYNRLSNIVRNKFKFILIALRTGLFLILFFCLWQPRITKTMDENLKNSYIAIAVDTSRSMTIPDGADKQTRIENIKTLLSEKSTFSKELLARVKPEKIKIYTFGNDCSKLTGKHSEMQANGERTNFQKCLNRISGDFANLPLSGCILFSDGNDNSNTDIDSLGFDMKNKNIPVYSIGTGGNKKFKDIEVLSLSGPEVAWERDLVSLKANIKARGEIDGPVSLVLKEGSKVLETRKVSPGRDGMVTSQTFNVIPVGKGTKSYNLSVAPLDGEMFTDNNKNVCNIYVSEVPEIKVLYISHKLGYDFMMIKGLADEQKFRIAAAIKTTAKTTLKQTLDGFDNLKSGFPATKEDLFRYNLLILNNISMSKMGAEQKEWIADFVKTRGGGLFIFGESNGFSEDGWSKGALGDLMPVKFGSSKEYTGLFDIKITEPGKAHDILKISKDNEQGVVDIETPKIVDYFAPVTSVKPGAVILAEVNNVPLLVAEQYGAGKVLFFGAGGLWKLRMQKPDNGETYKAFLKQIMRWLCIQNTASEGISVKPDKSVYFSSDKAKFEAVCYDKEGVPVKNAGLRGKLLENGGKTTQVQLIASADGKFTGEVELTKTGLSEIIVDSGSSAYPSASVLVYVKSGDLEFKTMDLNEHNMKKLSGLSGGKYFRIDDLDELYKNLDRSVEAKVSKTLNNDLWDKPWVLILLLLLFFVELLLRKQKSLL
ncbi:MAG: hypothetical protein A2231_08905 [Candidatus Firestonebacteria bacterium RIFOXYA2_FULL_40_8]|nr:MAG: hypothetical protein A2231_08905 [Candidatus Firestonebacteria bacterium RIFOXYA2_FULL_40_8]